MLEREARSKVYKFLANMLHFLEGKLVSTKQELDTPQDIFFLVDYESVERAMSCLGPLPDPVKYILTVI